MQFLYLLHFDTNLSHAEHYLGSTGNLAQRLHTHAVGNGARITEVLHEQSIGWQVAALWTGPDGVSIFEVERQAKRKHNGKSLCPICMNQPARPQNAQPVNLEHITIPLKSIDYQ